MSKSGKIQWAPYSDETLRYVPVATRVTPGATLYAVARVSRMEDCFSLYLTDAMVQMSVDYTNLHGQRFTRHWTDTDPAEMRAFFSLLLLARVYHSCNEATEAYGTNRRAGLFFVPLCH